jgi:hypothetical protein
MTISPHHLLAVTQVGMIRRKAKFRQRIPKGAIQVTRYLSRNRISHMFWVWRQLTAPPQKTRFLRATTKGSCGHKREEGERQVQGACRSFVVFIGGQSKVLYSYSEI